MKTRPYSRTLIIAIERFLKEALYFPVDRSDESWCAEQKPPERKADAVVAEQGAKAAPETATSTKDTKAKKNAPKGQKAASKKAAKSDTAAPREVGKKAIVLDSPARVRPNQFLARHLAAAESIRHDSWLGVPEL